MDTETYESLGLHKTFNEAHGNVKVNGRSQLEILDALDTPGDAAYHPCPQAYAQPDTPAGKVTAFHDWQGSSVYPGTQRHIWLYVPQQLAPLARHPASCCSTMAAATSTQTARCERPQCWIR